MKKGLPTLLIVLLFVVGLLITSYPLISNWYHESNQIHTIEEYTKLVENKGEQELETELKKAEKYNEELRGNIEITDPFTPDTQLEVDNQYEELLNINEDGVMGYVQIPSIGVYLPIYHGTEEDVLKQGAGHLLNTSLPVGNESTHTVITGHTGLSSSKLFTDLSKLVEGDVFYFHILNRTIAYQIDQIKIVEPNEISDLLITEGKDYATLVTCTPYAINSHRLLVRGSRIVYVEEIQQEGTSFVSESNSIWLQEYIKVLIRAAVVCGFIVVAIMVVRRYRKSGE